MTSCIVVPGARHWPLAALLLTSVLWGDAITGTTYAPFPASYGRDDPNPAIAARRHRNKP